MEMFNILILLAMRIFMSVPRIKENAHKTEQLKQKKLAAISERRISHHPFAAPSHQHAGIICERLVTLADKGPRLLQPARVT